MSKIVESKSARSSQQIGGVIMADFWLYRQNGFANFDTRQPNFNWAGIIAYVLASA